MRFHIQPTNMGWFVLRPRIRVYRRPLLIWIRWFNRSLFIERAPAVCSHDDQGGPRG